MIVSAIVATSRNRAIGKDGQIPWYLPADLKYFKRTTLNHAVIMGRKTFESIGRPLPKRTNIVVTRNPFYAASGVLVAASVEEALGLAYDQGETEAFIIGGGEIYRLTEELWDRLYLTEVALDVPDADAFFPELTGDWREMSSDAHTAEGKNEVDYRFVVLERAVEEDQASSEEE